MAVVLSTQAVCFQSVPKVIFDHKKVPDPFNSLHPTSRPNCTLPPPPWQPLHDPLTTTPSCWQIGFVFQRNPRFWPKNKEIGFVSHSWFHEPLTTDHESRARLAGPNWLCLFESISLPPVRILATHATDLALFRIFRLRSPLGTATGPRIAAASLDGRSRGTEPNNQSSIIHYQFSLSRRHTLLFIIIRTIPPPSSRIRRFSHRPQLTSRSCRAIIPSEPRGE